MGPRCRPCVEDAVGKVWLLVRAYAVARLCRSCSKQQAPKGQKDQRSAHPGGIGRAHRALHRPEGLLLLRSLARSAPFGRSSLGPVLHLTLAVLGAPHLLEVTT